MRLRPFFSPEASRVRNRPVRTDHRHRPPAGPLLTDRTQVEMVLQHLPQQYPAALVDQFLELRVSQSRRFVRRQISDEGVEETRGACKGVSTRSRVVTCHARALLPEDS
ncbi:hypothetical protein GCM10023075_53880 [Streptosporangium album]